MSDVVIMNIGERNTQYADGSGTMQLTIQTLFFFAAFFAAFLPALL
jgi:hypothetical protein